MGSFGTEASGTVERALSRRYTGGRNPPKTLGVVDIQSDMAAVQMRIAQITGMEPAAPEIAAPAAALPATGAASFASVLDRLMHEPGGMPGTGAPMVPPVDGPITSDFGERANPMGAGTEFHPGIDIGADEGTPIRAAMAGTVVDVSRDGGYGNLITVDDGNGLTTRYAHCSQIFARIGEAVRPGDVIGAVGMTGRATGPHLHFEVRQNDRAVDPRPYFASTR